MLNKSRLKPKGNSAFTEFIRNASAAEKKKVYTEVMKRASAMQKKVLDEAAEAKTSSRKNSENFPRGSYSHGTKISGYGRGSAYGWDIDHIKPKARGGSDGIRNPKASNSKTNRPKGDSQVKRSGQSERNK